MYNVNTNPKLIGASDPKSIFSKKEYEFPNMDIQPLLERLRQHEPGSFKSLRGVTDLGGPDGYSDVRIKFCAVNIAMNERCIFPPSFRRLRTPHHPSPKSEEERDLSLDRQMIDLHYLFHCRKDEVKIRDREINEWFSMAEFDFAKASEFISDGKTAIIKSRKLGLTDDLQKELLTIRSPKVRDLWKILRRQISDLENSLRNRANQTGSRFRIDNTDQRLDEFLCLRLGNGSPTKAIKYWALIHPGSYEGKKCNALKSQFSRRLELFKGLGFRFR